jgi:hypothetical protein
MDLDDVLSEPKEREPDPVEKVIQEGEERVTSRRAEWRNKELDARAEGEGKVRDPVTGQFVPKEPKEEPKPEVKAEEPKPEPKVEKQEQQEFTPKERALLATAQEERRKRQELEQQLAQYRQQQPPAEAPKPFWDDPDNALKARDEQINATRQEFAQTIFRQRLEFTEELARVKYPDYNEVVEVFKEVASQAPGLVQQCMASQNPAEFAYKLGKHHKEMREVGSVDAYKQKLEKELRLKVEAELKEKYEKEMKARQELVPSLSDARSTQSNKAVWGGPTPLDSVLGS